MKKPEPRVYTVTVKVTRAVKRGLEKAARQAKPKTTVSDLVYKKIKRYGVKKPKHKPAPVQEPGPALP